MSLTVSSSRAGQPVCTQANQSAIPRLCQSKSTHAVQSRAWRQSSSSMPLGHSIRCTVRADPLAWHSRGRRAGSRRRPLDAGHLGCKAQPSRAKTPWGCTRGGKQSPCMARCIAQAGARARRTAAPPPQTQPSKAQKQHPTPPAQKQPPRTLKQTHPHPHAENSFGTLYTLHEHAGPPGYMDRGMQIAPGRTKPWPSHSDEPAAACAEPVTRPLQRRAHHSRPRRPAARASKISQHARFQPQAPAVGSAAQHSAAQFRLPQRAAASCCQPTYLRELTAHARLPRATSGGSAHRRQSSTGHQRTVMRQQGAAPHTDRRDGACATCYRQRHGSTPQPCGAASRSSGALNRAHAAGCGRQRGSACAGARGGRRAPARLTSRQTGRRPRRTG